MLPARRWGDERRWHRAIVRRRSPHGRAPTAPHALGAQGKGEDSRVNVQHGMVAADPDGFQWRTIRGAITAACVGPYVGIVPSVAGATRRVVHWGCRGAIAR